MTQFAPQVTGTRHMVAAGHPAAAHAGFLVLEGGGNAVDAAIAAAICLCVVQSDIVNFGGVAPMVIHMADRSESVVIDGVGGWPRAASAELFRDRFGGAIPESILRTIVPAAPAAYLLALERYGTMRFADVAAPAIRFARDGFPMHALMADWITRFESKYRRWPSNEAVYLPGGKPPLVGQHFFQPDLARTLQFMVDEEAARASAGRVEGLRAARHAFYRGDLADRIVAFHRDNGGLLTHADLADFQVRPEPPVRSRFRDLDILACGTWSQGPVLNQALNILAHDDLQALGHNSSAYIHRVTEALKLAFADRHAYYGDPAFVDVPLDWLLSPAYAQQRRALVRDDVALQGMPPAGSRGGRVAASGGDLTAAMGDPPPPPDTSYACAVDRWGNAASITPSDASCDSPVIPGTGLCPSSRGGQSWVDAAHPACLAPGKRPRMTPSPAMALRGGKVFMPWGSPGADVQPQAMLQTLLNVVVFDMQVQAAVDAPRFATYSFPESFEPHHYYPGRLNLERRIDPGTAQELAALGHQVAWWDDFDWHAGNVCSIVADTSAGTLRGGADRRRPGYVLGW
jgi:gamma-glutamyltranspeptidase/glutathione hydrolase